MAAGEAAAAGRPDPSRHAMQVWCGLADSKEAARACLAPAMQAFYQIPFERFERYCPYGTADDVAEFLAPYADAGCVEFNMVPQSPGPDQAIAGLAAVKKLLAQACQLRWLSRPVSAARRTAPTAATPAASSPPALMARPRSRCGGHRRWPGRWPSSATVRAPSASSTATC